MEVKNKNGVTPTLNAADRYRRDIVDIVGKIEDERFLKRVYISLREYARERGLE